MRIISGTAAGIRLKSPPGPEVRPTADRVKEALFAALGDIRGFQVADLFAGSGALGLEALSRGAETAVFVDNNRRHLRCLNGNLDRVLHSLSTSRQPPGTGVRPGNAWQPQRILKDLYHTLDLILMDPPYIEAEQEGRLHTWLSSADIANWAGDALLVLEHPRRIPLPWHPLGTWRLLRQKRYGDTLISFARAADMPPQTAPPSGHSPSS